MFDSSGETSALTWILSLGATAAVGLSGILPLFVISPEMGVRLKSDGETGATLRMLLGFAVGGLLGDAFLHLIPESFEAVKKSGSLDDETALRVCGVWILIGLFAFVLVEIIFSMHQRLQEEQETQEALKKHDCDNGLVRQNAGKDHRQSKIDDDIIHISGYLNLVANSIDNFSHGLAVAGSFIAGTKVGLITTFAILLHEIPHEVGDFAILLKSGFTRWQAAKAQMSTASVGVLGAVVALSVEHVDSLGRCTSYILPFTAGGFINIALIGVLPELLKERDVKESLKQFGCVFLGILMMALVQMLTH